MSSLISVQGSSGLDINSIISSQVNVKRESYNSKISARKSTLESNISGVGKLKSYLGSFQSKLKETLNTNDILTGENTKSNLDAYKITRSNTGLDNKNRQSFSIEADKDSQAQEFEFEIKQLAKKENVSQVLQDQTFSSGTLTFSLGMGADGNALRFSVEVQNGDNLEAIQKKIANNDYGVQSTLVNTGTVNAGLAGYMFSISGGKTGDNATNLTIEGSTEELQNVFGLSSESDGHWSKHQKAQSAIAEYNGTEIKSDTNSFKNIPGLTIEAKEVTGEKESISVEKDYNEITNNVNETISSFNSLLSNLDKLTKSNTYTDGYNNYDGGDLANNSVVKSIGKVLKGVFTSSMFYQDENKNSLADLGLSLDKKGNITFDQEKFKKTIESDPKAIELLNGENGLFNKLEKKVSDYLSDDSVVSSLSNNYDKQLSYIEDQEERYNTMIEKYRETLIKKYTAMEDLISSYNSKLDYVSNILNQG